MAGKEEAGVRVENVVQALGPLSVFTLVQSVCFLTGYLSDSYQFYAYVFTGQDVPHSCAPPANNSEVAPDFGDIWLNSSDVTYGSCVISVVTNISGDVRTKELGCVYGMEYGKPKDTSIVSEFDLVCDQKALASLTQTLLYLGNGVGAIICPWLSDLFGRKRVLVISQTLTIGTSLLSAFAPTYAIYAAARFGCGFLVAGIGVIAITAAVEILPSSHRGPVAGVWGCAWWAVSIASLPLVAYGLRHYSWRILQLSLTSSTGIIILMIPVLNEPIQWLVANGKTKEAERVIKRAAKWNGKDPQLILNIFHGGNTDTTISPTHDSQPLNAPRSEETLPLTEWENAHSLNGLHSATQGEGVLLNGVETSGEVTSSSLKKEDFSDEKEEGTLPFSSLIRHRRLRINIVLTWFLWFINCLVYDALYLLSGTLALEIYWSFLLNAMVEGAAALVMMYTLDRHGRKWTIGLFHAVAGVGLLASGACFHFEDNHALQIAGTVFSLCGKMAISGSYNCLFLYTPEIFPTNIRNRALGTSLTAATLGGMVASFSNVLVDYAVWAPGAVFGTCSFLALLALLVLPESLGRELPQNIRDLESWYDVTSSTEKEQESSVTVSPVSTYDDSGLLNMSSKV
ncbi:hypothetical protein ACOMHN_049898 [Nucella lapillus]